MKNNQFELACITKEVNSFLYGSNKRKRTLFNSAISFLCKKVYREKTLYSSEDMNIIDNDAIKEELLENKKIAIYSCIIGNYEKAKEYPFKDKRCDYFLFTDNVSIKSDFWRVKPIPDSLTGKSKTYINRYIKMHPNELFSNYDYVIYVDGSVLITGDIIRLLSTIDKSVGMSGHRHSLRDCVYDEAVACFATRRGNKKNIKKQMSYYKKSGFPRHFGLIECTLLFTKIGEESAHIYNLWWDEFIRSKSNRDQLALPFVFWKLGIDPKMAMVVGTNILNSNDFIVFPHR